MYHDLTKGNISRSLLLFALPMMAGNLLQQFYNIADTLIVGRVLGRDCVSGGSWLCLYTDDFSYVYLSGVKFRFRGAVFYLQGQRG